MIWFIRLPHLLTGSHSSGIPFLHVPQTPEFLNWPLNLLCCFPCLGDLHIFILVYTFFQHDLVMLHGFIILTLRSPKLMSKYIYIHRNSCHKVMISTSTVQFSSGTPFSKCQEQNSSQIQNCSFLEHTLGIDPTNHQMPKSFSLLHSVIFLSSSPPAQ